MNKSHHNSLNIICILFLFSLMAGCLQEKTKIYELKQFREEGTILERWCRIDYFVISNPPPENSLISFIKSFNDTTLNASHHKYDSYTRIFHKETNVINKDYREIRKGFAEDLISHHNKDRIASYSITKIKGTYHCYYKVYKDRILYSSAKGCP